MFRRWFIGSTLLLILSLLTLGYTVGTGFFWGLLLISPFLLLGLYDILQRRNTVLRNFPLVGHVKYILTTEQHLWQEWILENDLDGRPFNRLEREIVDSRASGGLQTQPFGTEFDYGKEGYQWMLHSMAPSREVVDTMRVTVGGPDCLKPYSCSIFNVSAMSYGSISPNATLALNGGAAKGGFAQNTGEGGISEYHLRNGSDLIWQIGTGYFGCRTKEGEFDPKIFAREASREEVKMIEIKISQGAKPGFGAILPASKNTEEIARIRMIDPHEQVLSPPGHSQFSTPLELLSFISTLRHLSQGKPIGFKLCVGKPHEFLAICKGMIQSGVTPDFITIDSAEGGTGAAHFDSIHWVGMPMEEGLAFVHDALVGFNLREKIRLFASGKIISGFQIVKAMALGADACYSARGMMFALGCVQALECNRNTCPTGITTMNPALIKGLVVPDKAKRVADYHALTIESVKEMLRSAGLAQRSELDRSIFCRRISSERIATFEELYPSVEAGSLLQEPYPERFRLWMNSAAAYTFKTVK